MEEVKNTKLIGIGNEGIKKLEEVESKIVEKIDTEKININKDVDKDYVRALLDGVDILLLTYNSEDKQALQIVNAIGYMADERRVLSVGLDLSEKENKKEQSTDAQSIFLKITEIILRLLYTVHLSDRSFCISDERVFPHLQSCRRHS